MPNIKEISSYQPPQKTTSVFFFLDICYPSDEARKAQKKVVNSILMSLNAFAGTRQLQISIGELQIGEHLKWASPTLTPLEAYKYDLPMEGPSYVPEAVFRAAPEEIAQKFSSEAFFNRSTSPAGYYLPILFFFFNTAEALLAFCSGSETLHGNRWYREALRNDSVILGYADSSCNASAPQTSALDGHTALRVPKITPAGLFFENLCPEDFLLHFEYTQLDDETIGNILALPFCRFQSGGRDGYVMWLHKHRQKEEKPIND